MHVAIHIFNIREQLSLLDYKPSFGTSIAAVCLIARIC